VPPNYYYLFNLSRDQRLRAVVGTIAGTLSPTMSLNKQYPATHPRLMPPKYYYPYPPIHPSYMPPVIITYLVGHVTKCHVTTSRDVRHSFISSKVVDGRGPIAETAPKQVRTFILKLCYKTTVCPYCKRRDFLSSPWAGGKPPALKW
jgi:hypothetical protein